MSLRIPLFTLAVLSSTSLASAQGEAPPPAPPPGAAEPAAPATPPPPPPPAAAAPAQPAPAPAPAPGYGAQPGPGAQAWAPAAAPPPSAGGHTHDGFYLRLGIGVGSYSGESKPDGGGYTIDVSGVGPSVEIALGGTVAPGVVIGGGIYGSTIPTPKYEYQNLSEDGGQAVGSMLGPFVDWYFDPHGGFHAQAALGYTAISAAKGDNYPGEDSSGGGTGVMAGVGYEAWVGEEWGVGGLARVHYFSGEVEGDDSGNKSDVSGTVLSILFTATLH
ncbi:MAG: hypothetical protein U0263_39355 [Polyangiaceae bacterium]